MDIKGRVVQVLPVVSGTSKAGKDWSKQDFVIETPGQYPKKVALTLWGEDKINQYDLQIGLEATFHIELESREYNGRWYTEARAWKIEWTAEARKWNAQEQKKAAAAPETTSQKMDSVFDNSELPF